MEGKLIAYDSSGCKKKESVISISVKHKPLTIDKRDLQIEINKFKDRLLIEGNSWKTIALQLKSKPLKNHK